MNLQSDDFALFGLPARYAQDRAQIDSRWKDLQRQAHPDKFADQGAATQRLAMQWSVRINQAYRRLKDPLQRAVYLCELHGIDVKAENNTAMSTDFLMQQMAWREALDEAQGAAAVQQIQQEVEQAKAGLLAKIEQLIDHEQNYIQAADQIRALMFVLRFAADIEQRLFRLES